MYKRLSTIALALALAGVASPASADTGGGPAKLASDSSLYSNHPSYGSGRATPKGPNRWLVTANDTVPGHGCVAVTYNTGRRNVVLAMDCTADGKPTTSWVTASHRAQFDLFITELGLGQALLPQGQRPRR